MNYECKRCFYKTTLKTDMRRHLNRKIKCPRIVESYKYTEDELETLSLTLINKNDNLDKNEIKDVSENEIKDSSNINDIVLYITKNKINKCMYCNAQYSRHYELKRHIKNNCKMLNKGSDQLINNVENKVIKNSVTNNVTNITNNQQVNNITINVYNNNNNPPNNILLPFDDKWDISKIDDKKKLTLFLEDKKYSKTMEEILKNDKNLNVIFDKDNDLGLIYKNDVEKFINMKTNDIIDEAMLKIYNHLIEFYDEMIDKGYVLSELNSHKKLVEEKYEEFNTDKNKKTKDIVKNILVDIFDKNKDKVIERFIEYNMNEQNSTTNPTNLLDDDNGF
jgi:hypothetical protein